MERVREGKTSKNKAKEKREGDRLGRTDMYECISNEERI